MTKDVIHKIYTEEYVENAQLVVNTLAKELELLARDLRMYAEDLSGTVAKDSHLTPTGIASGIVDMYLRRVGNGGVRLGELVSSAGKAEAHRALIESER
jgi:hypothetical protein